MNCARAFTIFSLISAGLVTAFTTTVAGQEPETLALWPGQAPVSGGKTEKANAAITVFRPANGNGTAMVICPGGGYGGLVQGHEGTGIATWLNQHGIVGIVLEYRLPAGDPVRPLSDVQRAIRMARSKAAEWQCNPNRIGVIGFSAGGHVASTAATHFEPGDAGSDDPLNRISSRPDFAIMVYPVISMGPKTHGRSKQNLLGANPTEEMVTRFSNELQVTPDTPPTFLAHAVNDHAVPAENSRMFYAALLAHQVPAKYLELPSGGHGLNGYRGPMWEAWQTQSLEWLTNLKLTPKETTATKQ